MAAAAPNTHIKQHGKIGVHEWDNFRNGFLIAKVYEESDDDGSQDFDDIIMNRSFYVETAEEASTLCEAIVTKVAGKLNSEWINHLCFSGHMCFILADKKYGEDIQAYFSVQKERTRVQREEHERRLKEARENSRQEWWLAERQKILERWNADRQARPTSFDAPFYHYYASLVDEETRKFARLQYKPMSNSLREMYVYDHRFWEHRSIEPLAVVPQAEWYNKLLSHTEVPVTTYVVSVTPFTATSVLVVTYNDLREVDYMGNVTIHADVPDVAVAAVDEQGAVWYVQYGRVYRAGVATDFLDVKWISPCDAGVLILQSGRVTIVCGDDMRVIETHEVPTDFAKAYMIGRRIWLGNSPTNGISHYDPDETTREKLRLCHRVGWVGHTFNESVMLGMTKDLLFFTTRDSTICVTVHSVTTHKDADLYFSNVTCMALTSGGHLFLCSRNHIYVV